MLMFKYDVCKKEIKDRTMTVKIGTDFSQSYFCFTCGKPVLDFLKKHKLFDSKEKQKTKTEKR